MPPAYPRTTFAATCWKLESHCAMIAVSPRAGAVMRVISPSLNLSAIINLLHEAIVLHGDVMVDTLIFNTPTKGRVGNLLVRTEEKCVNIPLVVSCRPRPQPLDCQGVDSSSGRGKVSL